MKDRLFKVESDCLDIIKRIQSIDKDYFVLYNLDKEKFELHCSSQKKRTYCLTFPFDTLDERAYLYTLQTRVQNSDELFAQMEKDNQKLVDNAIKSTLNDFKERLYDS